MLTVIRELAEAAEARAGARRRRSCSRCWSSAARRRSRARPSSSTCCARRGWWTPAERAWWSSSAGSRRRLAAKPSPAPRRRPGLALEAVHQEPSRYRYCTTFVVEGDGLDATALEPELERLGDSLLVVGDPTALKVHVHTDDPGAALSLGTRAGTIEGVEIADMHRQTEEREERLLAALPGGARARPSSPWSPVRATGACSRTSARSESSRAARR